MEVGDFMPVLLQLAQSYQNPDSVNYKIAYLQEKIGDKDFGKLAFEDQVQLAMLGETVIVGGFLRTELIAAKSIHAEHLDVEDLSAITGKFTFLMAGNPFGARLELGESAGEPFLTFYDANEKRLSILKDKIEFHKDSSLAGYLEAVYTEAKDEYGAPFDNLNIAVNSRAFTLKGMLVLKTPDSDANQQVYFGQGYSLYCDSVGAGADNTRLWLHAPNNGEVVIGPRGGANYLHLLRLRASTIQVEGNITARLAGSYDLGTETSPFRFLYLSRLLGFRGSATAIDIIAHDTDHWLGFYDRAATAYRLRLFQDRCHVYNDLRYDGGLYQGSTRGVPRADVRTGTSSASGSIAAKGFASVSMADYSFFPNVYSEAIMLSVNTQNDISTGTTGRFVLRNEGTVSYNYVVRWRYIAS